jgi:hypothetical protein
LVRMAAQVPEAVRFTVSLHFLTQNHAILKSLACY